MNLCNTIQPGWRHDGESRSMYRGRVVAQPVSRMAVSTKVAGSIKPTRFEDGGLARWESPG